MRRMQCVSNGSLLFSVSICRVITLFSDPNMLSSVFSVDVDSDHMANLISQLADHDISVSLGPSANSKWVLTSGRQCADNFSQEEMSCKYIVMDVGRSGPTLLPKIFCVMIRWHVVFLSLLIFNMQ